MAPISVPVNEPLLNGNEAKYLLRCVETGWISSDGPFVQEFEQKFAARVDRKYGVAVCNGSAAIDAAVAALDIGPGDEVIMPTFTIISCAASVARIGAKPILVDCDPVTWNMNVRQIESKITPKTKAIMVVHIYSHACDMDPILEIAKKYNLKVIEDAAEMFP
jgi:perosamine synthetase